MNNKGQIPIFFTLMLGITIIVLALAFAPVVKEFVDDARDVNSLGCNNSTISTFDKATCIVADVSTFGFIGGLLMLAGVIIGARLVFSG